MEWINVKDGLPNIDDMVLCMTENILHPFVATFDEKGEFVAELDHIEAHTDYDYSSADIVETYTKEQLYSWALIVNLPL